MTWAKGAGILCLCAVLCLVVAGQSPGPQSPAQNGQPKSANPQPKGANHKNGAPKPVYQMGDWLRAHQNLPPDQQEKLLESDPSFKRLPAQRQAELKERLRKFNSLTPAQRELALNRLQWMAKLTPQQRQDIRDANKTLETLPQDRRVMVHKALRHLRQMDPQERQQEFESDRFKSTFSEQEQGVLAKLAAINPPENNGGGNGVVPASETPK